MKARQKMRLGSGSKGGKLPAAERETILQFTEQIKRSKGREW